MKYVWSFLFRKSTKYNYTEVADIPKNPIERKIYLIGENGQKWLAAFKCPCGCGDLIQLNLLEGGEHQWYVKIQEKKITISPSIYRQFSCGSHFTITRGELDWF